MATPIDVGFVEMRLAKVVAPAVSPDEEPSFFMVLEGVSQDRRLPIEIGQMEGFTLAATVTGFELARPMSPQFAAGLLRASGGRVHQVRIDRLITALGGTAYGATVEVEGSSGVQAVDARPSDALNLLALMPAPIFVAPEVLAEVQARMEGDSPQANLLRRAAKAEQMTVGQRHADR